MTTPGRPRSSPPFGIGWLFTGRLMAELQIGAVGVLTATWLGPGS
jgi:hypothetical protein